MGAVLWNWEPKTLDTRTCNQSRIQHRIRNHAAAPWPYVSTPQTGKGFHTQKSARHKAKNGRNPDLAGLVLRVSEQVCLCVESRKESQNRKPACLWKCALLRPAKGRFDLVFRKLRLVSGSEMRYDDIDFSRPHCRHLGYLKTRIFGDSICQTC